MQLFKNITLSLHGILMPHDRRICWNKNHQLQLKELSTIATLCVAQTLFQFAKKKKKNFYGSSPPLLSSSIETFTSKLTKTTNTNIILNLKVSNPPSSLKVLSNTHKAKIINLISDACQHFSKNHTLAYIILSFLIMTTILKREQSELWFT
jgi:hypothetical protein